MCVNNRHYSAVFSSGLSMQTEEIITSKLFNYELVSKGTSLTNRTHLQSEIRRIIIRIFHVSSMNKKSRTSQLIILASEASICLIYDRRTRIWCTWLWGPVHLSKVWTCILRQRILFIKSNPIWPMAINTRRITMNHRCISASTHWYKIKKRGRIRETICRINCSLWASSPVPHLLSYWVTASIRCGFVSNCCFGDVKCLEKMKRAPFI